MLPSLLEFTQLFNGNSNSMQLITVNYFFVVIPLKLYNSLMNIYSQLNFAHYMLALFSMLGSTYYVQNYAKIMWTCSPNYV